MLNWCRAITTCSNLKNGRRIRTYWRQVKRLTSRNHGWIVSLTAAYVFFQVFSLWNLCHRRLLKTLGLVWGFISKGWIDYDTRNGWSKDATYHRQITYWFSRSCNENARQGAPTVEQLKLGRNVYVVIGIKNNHFSAFTGKQIHTLDSCKVRRIPRK